MQTYPGYVMLERKELRLTVTMPNTETSGYTRTFFLPDNLTLDSNLEVLRLIVLFYFTKTKVKFQHVQLEHVTSYFTVAPLSSPHPLRNSGHCLATLFTCQEHIKRTTSRLQGITSEIRELGSSIVPSLALMFCFVLHWCNLFSLFHFVILFFYSVNHYIRKMLPYASEELVL